MKILLYGNNANVVGKSLEIKHQYKKEQVYELVGEIGTDEIEQYLTSVNMFGTDELLYWRVNKKTEISDKILKLIKGKITKNLLVVLSENLPKNSKFFKYFDKSEQFIADEKEKIFPLLEAISNKNPLLSVKLFYKLINQKNDPVYINSMLFYQFKNILHVRFDTETIKSINPYVKSKLTLVKNNFSDTECVKIISEIYAVDLKLKTTSIDSEVVVLNLILKIVNGKLNVAQYV